jgi:hypothetical protein
MCVLEMSSRQHRRGEVTASEKVRVPTLLSKLQSSASGRCLRARFAERGSMTATLDVGERFGALECIAEVVPDRYRCRCLRCRYDGALVTVGSLLTRKVGMCFDCAALERLTPHQRVVAAFRRKLDLSAPREELDRVDAIPAVASLTLGEALSEAA